MFDDLLSRSIDFSGRTRRRDFWPLAIVAWITRWIGLLFVFFGFGSLSAAGMGYGGGAVPLGILLILGGGAYMLWITIALMSATARRMHDIGLPGWLALLHFAPFLDLALYGLALIEGPAGPNAYGEDPKRPPERRSALVL